MARKLGPYEIRSELGRGAMAQVWRAYDPVLDREVAIKEPLLPKGVDSSVAAEYGARFVREGRAAAKLSHPNIVTIHAADIYDGRAALVMELVEGQTLGELLSRGPVDKKLAFSLMEQLLSAVGYAHPRGIVHRDIKPDNIFVTPDGRVKLADFGIASLATDATLTQAGTVMGTPGYMAPEQITGEAVGARADVFALGVVFYEMLTGHNPFGASEGLPSTTVMYRIVHQAPPELPSGALAGLPAQLRQVLEVALAKDPADRFPDAQSFLGALRGEGPLPVPGAYAAQVSGPRAGTMMARAAMIKQKTMFGRPAGPAANAGWLHSWLPYAVVVGIGLIVMIALLVSAKSGGGGSAYSSVTPEAVSADLSSKAVLSASSTHQPTRGDTWSYNVTKLVDGSAETCWTPRRARWSGAWVQFDFASPVTVTQLQIIAGYEKVDWVDHWPTNNRLRGFRVEFSDGSSQTCEVQDVRGYQTVTLTPTTTSYVRVVVLSVYYYQLVDGTGWDDLCVAEIRPWGY